MATSNSTPPASYIEMSRGDVDNIGAHCQLEYCHVLDFLPFKCQSCRGTFCLDHRSEHAHKCAHEGLWARERAARLASTAPLTPKPTLHTHDRQCAETTCKTLIYTSLVTGVHCTRCNRHYCLKHRMEEEHNCKNLEPIGARPKNALQERTSSALGRLKIWAENKRREDEKRRAGKKSGFLGMGSSSKSAAVAAQTEVNALKRVAKGEASVPSDKRIYLLVEASADTTKAKFPTGKFFYNADWTVGRVLDMAAKALQVQNVNNRGGGEEEKLRVFHVEGGRLLKFGEKIGDSCKNGNMIVLLRGVGSGEPDLIDL